MQGGGGYGGDGLYAGSGGGAYFGAEAGSSQSSSSGVDTVSLDSSMSTALLESAGVGLLGLSTFALYFGVALSFGPASGFFPDAGAELALGCGIFFAWTFSGLVVDG